MIRTACEERKRGVDGENTLKIGNKITLITNISSTWHHLNRRDLTFYHVFDVFVNFVAVVILSFSL